MDAADYYQRTCKVLGESVMDKDLRLVAARNAEDLRAARSAMFGELDGIQRMVLLTAPCPSSRARALKACVVWRREATVLAEARESQFRQITEGVCHG